MKKKYPFIKYKKQTFGVDEMKKRSRSFLEQMDKRRSIRDFSDRPVPKEVIENIIMTASTAPSGAHKQPWTFCVISNDNLKSRIRELAEAEEKVSYNGRMSEQWLKDLEPLGTTWEKEFIDDAPWIIVVMKRVYEENNGDKNNNYYVSESVGLACGFLLAAVHHAGLVALTHTPSPMNFLVEALNRPSNERPFLLIPIGYPAEDVQVPDLKRKSFTDVAVYYE